MKSNGSYEIGKTESKIAIPKKTYEMGELSKRLLALKAGESLVVKGSTQGNVQQHAQTRLGRGNYAVRGAGKGMVRVWRLK